MDILLAVDLELHGPPAVGAVEGTGPHVLRHVHGGAFEVVAHQFHHFMHTDLVVGLDPQGQAFGGGVSHGVGLVAFHVRGHTVEEGIHAGLAGTQAREGEGVVGVGIAEVGIGVLGLAGIGCPAMLLGKGDHIRAVDAFHLGLVDIV